jgi:hypothetical protein
MSKFTAEEKALITYLANTSDGAADQIAEHATYIVPGILIAVYGIYTKAMLAVVIGASAILIYQVLRIRKEIQYGRLYKSIFSKIEEIEKASEERSA